MSLLEGGYFLQVFCYKEVFLERFLIVAGSSRMKRPSSTTVLLAGSILVSGVAAVATALFGGQEAMRSSFQLGVFPILLVLLSALKVKGVRLPRLVVGLSAIGVLCGAIVRYSDVGLQDGAFGVARFESDTLENKTRIFRDNVRRFAGPRAATQVGVIAPRVSSESDARKVLAERPQLGGVIWGSERWIQISTRLAPPISLRQMPDTSYARRRLAELGISDLQIMDRAPLIGFSNGLDPASFEFVGALIRASSMSPRRAGGEVLSPELEQLLQRASSIRARWSTSDHLAAPKVTLGAYYLAQAIAPAVVEWGDLLCAESSLRSARVILNKGGNPELKAAVYNNEAVIRILTASQSANPDALMKEARIRLHQAYLTKRSSQLASLEPAYWAPIEANMRALGMAIPTLKKSRRK